MVHRQKAEKITPLEFYQSSDVVLLGQKLLGKRLFSRIDGVLTGGIIVETESYAGINDRASHAFNDRRTKRTEPMYKQGGISYVYLCYGMHALLNVVTGEKDLPHAVLIRAILPEVGIETMQKRRNQTSLKNLASGPAKLTQALGITLKHNTLPLQSDLLWIEEGIFISSIEKGPRIGVEYAKEDALLPYRFVARLDSLKNSLDSTRK